MIFSSSLARNMKIVKPKGIVVWGASGHALVVSAILQSNGLHILGYLDDVSPGRQGESFSESTILGGQEQLSKLKKYNCELVVAIGNCKARLEKTVLAKKNRFSLTNAIHPEAVVAESVKIGSGTVVCAGAIINPLVEIGQSVIINTGSIIEHGCVIEDGAHICPGVCLAGDVHVGKGCWIGAGTTVIEKLSIGDWTLVGAGSLVIRDLPPAIVAYGHPAKVVRPRDAHDIYQT